MISNLNICLHTVILLTVIKNAELLYLILHIIFYLNFKLITFNLILQYKTTKLEAIINSSLYQLQIDITVANHQPKSL